MRIEGSVHVGIKRLGRPWSHLTVGAVAGKIPRARPLAGHRPPLGMTEGICEESRGCAHGPYALLCHLQVQLGCQPRLPLHLCRLLRHLLRPPRPLCRLLRLQPCLLLPLRQLLAGSQRTLHLLQRRRAKSTSQRAGCRGGARGRRHQWVSRAAQHRCWGALLARGLGAALCTSCRCLGRRQARSTPQLRLPLLRLSGVLAEALCLALLQLCLLRQVGSILPRQPLLRGCRRLHLDAGCDWLDGGCLGGALPAAASRRSSSAGGAGCRGGRGQAGRWVRLGGKQVWVSCRGKRKL